MCYTIKHANTGILGMQRERREKGVENLSEGILAKISPNLFKKKKNIVHIPQNPQIPSRINP